MRSTKWNRCRPSSVRTDRAEARPGATCGDPGRGLAPSGRSSPPPIMLPSFAVNMRRRRSGCAELLAAEAALEPAHQRPCGALRRFLGHIAFVEALDARIKVNARPNQATGLLGEASNNFRIAFLSMAEPPFRPAAFAKGDLAT